MATRRELEDAIRECNQAARPHERRQILSEFVRVTGIIANIAARIESFADTTKAAPTGASFRRGVASGTHGVVGGSRPYLRQTARVIIPVLIEAREACPGRLAHWAR